jgi:hypothetical protein
MKTAISNPDNLFEEAERLAAELQTPDTHLSVSRKRWMVSSRRLGATAMNLTRGPRASCWSELSGDQCLDGGVFSSVVESFFPSSIASPSYESDLSDFCSSLAFWIKIEASQSGSRVRRSSV